MEEAAAEDPKSLIDAILTPVMLEEATVERLTEVKIEVVSAIERIGYLMRHITSMYGSDRQRQMAEAEVFRLKQRIVSLSEEEIGKAIAMATNLYTPVAAEI